MVLTMWAWWGLPQTFVLPSSPSHPAANRHQAKHMCGGAEMKFPSTPLETPGVYGWVTEESPLDLMLQFPPATPRQ